MQSETNIQQDSMMKDQIWVIGGYGQVGQMICTQLAQAFPGKVWAAGTRAGTRRTIQSSNGWCG